ncbi:MAG: Crp/Fnr family transcriptional regulator, partial [Proteobacteria bacterium]|nr:Crp/Fnr family transcriptional regulator [Pseudomonadota bacterium]
MKISAINLLEELNKPDYQDLMASFTRRSHAKGSMVYTPMAEEDNVFVLAQGRLRIFLSYEDKEFTLTILEPGQVYTTHTRAFVEAMEDCVVLVTDTMSFHKSLAEHPELTGAMINVLGGLLKNSFSIISGLVFKDVNRRLVEHLLAEARDCAKTDPADGP